MAQAATPASTSKTPSPTGRQFQPTGNPAQPALNTRGARSDLLALPAADGEVLNHLCIELNSCCATGTEGASYLQRLDDLHRNRHVIERCLRWHRDAQVFKRFCASLDSFVHSMELAVRDGRLDLSTLSNIETVCLGLTAATAGARSAFSAQSSARLRTLSRSMRQTVQQEDERQGLKSPGQRLNIQNWTHHGLSAGVIECDAQEREAARTNLREFAAWARQDLPLDAHNLGKCAIQVQSMCRPGRKLLDSRDPQVRQELWQLMQYFCSPQSSATLFASPFDPVPLANVCTCLRTLLGLGLASAADANLILDRLITPFSQLAATLMQRDDTRAMTRVANLLRQLLKSKADQHLSSDMGMRWARAVANLLQSCQATSFKSLPVQLADLGNLLHLALACRDWRARSAEQTGQLPGPAQLASICQAILARIPWQLAEFEDSEAAASLMGFFCIARSEALLDEAEILPHLRALLQAVSEQGHGWSEQRKNRMRDLIRQLSETGFDDPALQAALSALQSQDPGLAAAGEDAPAPSSLTTGRGRAPEPRIRSRDEGGFQLPSQTAKPVQPDARALSIYSALNDDDASLEYESEEELESGAAVSTTLAGHGSTSTTTSTTTTTAGATLSMPSRKDTRPLEQQLAEVPQDYRLHVPAFVPDRKKELEEERREQLLRLASTLQTAQFRNELEQEKALSVQPPQPPQSPEAIKEALFQRLYARMLEYIADDNAEKLEQVLNMPQGRELLMHRDHRQRNVLQIVIASSCEKIFSLLTRRSDLQEAVRQQALQHDYRGNSPLIVAAWSNHLPALNYLLGIPGVKKKLFEQRRQASSLEVVLNLSTQMKAAVTDSGNQPVLEPDALMDDAAGGPESDAFLMAIKNGSLQCLQRLLQEPLIQQKLKTAAYAELVVVALVNKPTPPALRLLLAIDSVRKKINEEGAPLLASMISKGDLVCLPVLLELADARALFNQRLMMPSGPVSVFEFLDRTPTSLQKPVRTLLQNAWNGKKRS